MVKSIALPFIGAFKKIRTAETRKTTSASGSKSVLWRASSQKKTTPVVRSYEAVVGQGVLRPVAIILAAVNVGVLVVYLFGINAYAATGYEMRSVQHKIDELLVEQRALQFKVAGSSSLSQVQAGLDGSRFVPVTTKEYLKIPQFSER